MMFVEFERIIISKLSRMNLDQFIKDRASFKGEPLDVDFSVEIWCDAILAWLGKQFPEKNKIRFQILERTKFDYKEYCDCCVDLVESYNKRLALRKFSDALFSENTVSPKADPIPDPAQKQPEPIMALVPEIDPDRPSRELIELAERFKQVFGEGPEKIRVRTSLERLDPYMPFGKEAEQSYRNLQSLGLIGPGGVVKNFPRGIEINNYRRYRGVGGNWDRD